MQSKINPGWKLSAQTYCDLMYKITVDLTRRLLTDPVLLRSSALQKKFLTEITKLVSDPCPDNSLEFTAEHALPLFLDGIAEGVVSPLDNWLSLGNASKHWPVPMRTAARRLGLGSKSLPSWQQIAIYFDSIGFKAVPVRGYIGAPLYHFMLNHRLAPVCTNWAVRYREQPYYYVAPIDALHDLGHGLAMAMDDYRSLALRLSKAALNSGRYMFSQDFERRYVRFFEYAHASKNDGLVEPIGPAAILCESVRASREGLASVVKESSLISSQPYKYRIFNSRTSWQRECKDFIGALK